MRRLLLITLLFNALLFGAGTIEGEIQRQALNISAIVMFLIFVAGTLGITYWASKQTKTASDFYTAGGGITGFQNGMAIAGDYMSAASFLGITGLVYLAGYDGLIYSIGFLVGWPIILFLISERLRNLGKYTFADVAAYRLKQEPIRILAASGSIATVILYLIAQMVGSGKLIELLFGLPYEWAVLLVGTLMILYVTFGGMLATTWVQIIKAGLLLSGATFMAVMVMSQFGFSFEALFAKAAEVHPKGESIMSPGGLVSDPISAISLGVALMFGTAGLPHILMRFFTVNDAKEARKSVFYATGFIGYFYILTFIIGFGAIVLVLGHPEYLDLAKQAVSGGTPILGGKNMAAIHLSHAVGGDLFLGFISAVAFATILAVVSGLTLAGATAVSHDLYANVFEKERCEEAKEMRVSKIATVVLGIIAIGLGIAFEKQNIAFVVGLAFAIAASANFPVLFLSMFWSKLTTRGAVIGGSLGLATAIILVILGPIVWVQIFGYEEAIFPYKYPALFSVSAAFIGIWFFSITDKSPSAQDEIDAYEAQNIRSQTGIGADNATYTNMQTNTDKLPGSQGEKELQKVFLTTQDALDFYNKQVLTHLAPLMQDFIAKQEMMFISTADSHGECDASFRAGEPGFVIVLDDKHILYPEYKGNGVMASMGNIFENPNIGLLFIDFFETKVGLHVNGKASIIKKEDLKKSLEVFEGAVEIIDAHKDKFKIVSYTLIEVEEAYIHCSLHIPILEKVDEKTTSKKFPKNSKGGDAFGVAETQREWVE